MVAAPDGTLWMALFGTASIGRINPADGALRAFTLPAPAARPRRLRVGGDNSVVGFDPVTERTETVAILTPGAVVRTMSVDSIRGSGWR